MKDNVRDAVLDILKDIQERLSKIEKTQSEHQKTQTEHLGLTKEIGIAVATLTNGQRELRSDAADLKESANITQQEIKAIRMRLDRIERHTNLVS